MARDEPEVSRAELERMLEMIEEAIAAFTTLTQLRIAVADAFEEASRQRAHLTMIRMRLQNVLAARPRTDTPTPVRPPSTDAFRAFENVARFLPKKDDDPEGSDT